MHSVWHQMTLTVNVGKSMLKEVDDFHTIDDTFDSNPIGITESDKASNQQLSAPYNSSDKHKTLKHNNMIDDKTVETLDINTNLSQESDKENNPNKDLGTTIEKIEKLTLKKLESSSRFIEEEKESEF